MATVTSKDGTKIAYDKTGQGPALIMVAGMFSYRKYAGQVKLAKLLSEHFTVYNYDRRGRGDSTDTAPYSTSKEVDDLKALINAAGGSAYVWGLSSGAALSLYAAAQGANITKLAIQEPPFVVDSGDRKPPLDSVEQLSKLVAANQLGEAVKYAMVDVMGAPKFVVSLMHIMPGVWQKLTAVANTLPYDVALVHDYQKGEPLPADSFKKINMPTLVMVGPESPAFFMNTAKSLANILPNAQLLVKKGLGHTKKLSTSLIASELISYFADSKLSGKPGVTEERQTA